MTGRQVTKGYIYYAATGRRQEVEFAAELRQQRHATIAAVRQLIESGERPPNPYTPRCKGAVCTMSAYHERQHDCRRLGRRLEAKGRIEENRPKAGGWRENPRVKEELLCNDANPVYCASLVSRFFPPLRLQPSGCSLSESNLTLRRRLV